MTSFQMLLGHLFLQGVSMECILISRVTTVDGLIISILMPKTSQKGKLLQSSKQFNLKMKMSNRQAKKQNFRAKKINISQCISTKSNHQSNQIRIKNTNNHKFIITNKIINMKNTISKENKIIKAKTGMLKIHNKIK